MDKTHSRHWRTKDILVFTFLVLHISLNIWLSFKFYWDYKNEELSNVKTYPIKDVTANPIQDLKRPELPHKASNTVQSNIPYDEFIIDISERYGFDPNLIRAIIWTESNFKPDAVNKTGTCVGLMQISTKWHTTRAHSLGVTDMMDPYGNILTGVDLLSDLRSLNSDLNWILAAYNCSFEVANKNYNTGTVGPYSALVQSRYNYLKEGGEINGL